MPVEYTRASPPEYSLLANPTHHYVPNERLFKQKEKKRSAHNAQRLAPNAEPPLPIEQCHLYYRQPLKFKLPVRDEQPEVDAVFADKPAVVNAP